MQGVECEYRGFSVGMREIWVKMRKMGGNQGGDAESQDWNLGIAVEMIKNSNGNDKFKEWRKVRITENEHICKTPVSHIWSGAFLVRFGYILILTQYVFLLYCWIWTGWKG